MPVEGGGVLADYDTALLALAREIAKETYALLNCVTTAMARYPPPPPNQARCDGSTMFVCSIESDFLIFIFIDLAATTSRDATADCSERGAQLGARARRRRQGRAAERSLCDATALRQQVQAAR